MIAKIESITILVEVSQLSKRLIAEGCQGLLILLWMTVQTQLETILSSFLQLKDPCGTCVEVKGLLPVTIVRDVIAFSERHSS